MKKLFALVLVFVMTFSMLNFASASGTEKYVVNTVSSPLNVRSGPGMKYEVFATLRKGTVVDVAGYENGWAIVLHDFGHGYAETIGFVDPSYLKKYNSGSSNSSSNGSVTLDGTQKFKVNEDMSGWLNVRKAAKKSSARLGKLYAGDTVYVVSQSGDWSKIVYNGRYAYVMTKYITGNFASNLPDEGELFKVRVTPGTKLNVRAGMSKKYDIIARLSNNEYIKVIKIYDEWSKIYYGDGKVGYVMNQFITPIK